MPVAIESRKPRFRHGIVRGRVLDANGKVVAARLFLKASDGRAYTQEESFHRVVPATRTHYQHVNGAFEIEVPVGPVTLEATRGFEFLPAQGSVDVAEGRVADIALTLRRIDEPRSRGWYSGDMHVHDLHEGRFGISQEVFFQQLNADDLGVANALIHMDGSKIMGRWDDLTGQPSPLSNDTTILRYSQEFRGAFGHIGLVGVEQFIMPLIGGATNTAFAPDRLGVSHIDAAHAQGAIAGFVHPYNHTVTTPDDAASAAIPVLAALGRGDFYDTVSIASRELDSAAIYYKLLNSGIRIAATGGTDNFSDVWFDPSGGAARTYARLDSAEAFTFESWIAAVRDGKTFASNGPLLFLAVNGRQPGQEIQIGDDASARLSINVQVKSIAPLESIEIVANGQVVEKWTDLAADSRHELETTIELPAGGWVTARAIGPQSRYVGDEFAFAQTSPVYVRRGGRQFSSVADADFLLQSVNALWQRVVGRDAWFRDEQRLVYEKYINEARTYYKNIILMHPQDARFETHAPETFTVTMLTTKGSFDIAVQRSWAPGGVDRFYNLVRNGYYDDTRIFRIRDKDFVQFGIHGEPLVAQAWRVQRIADDPVVKSNMRGTVAFAMGTAANDRTTQVYVNLKDKPELDAMGFSVMGEVISGMSVVDTLYSGYGESAAGGIRAGKQDPAFARGNAFFDENFPLLDSIIEAKIKNGTLQ
jgi:cyclophilin family peptidyl-prolyl cis-trans isomerase